MRPFRFYLASSASGRACDYLGQHWPDIESAAIQIAQAPNVLFSYAYRARAHHVLPFARRFLVDSGAYTAFTRGKAVDLNAYQDWALSLSAEWGGRVEALEFLALDVIGNHDQSLRNWFSLRGGGLNCLPVLTFEAPATDAPLLVKESRGGQIALGGMAPHWGDRPRLRRWLEQVFSEVPASARVHLLGVGGEWAYREFPATSGDSSTWAKWSAFRKHQRVAHQRFPHLDPRAALLAEHVRQAHNKQQMQRNIRAHRSFMNHHLENA